MSFAPEVIKDLAKSGLVPEDIRAKPLSPIEMAATGAMTSANEPLKGYVIPYYTIDGEPEKFYRVKLIGREPSYRQIKGETNHIYFPPNFAKLLRKIKKPKYVVLTEGEKKACAAVKNGILCCAVAGVDSWRNRIILLPEATEFEKSANGKWIRARLPQSADVGESDHSSIANGLQSLIDMVVRHNCDLIICYDTDDGEIKPAVQTAAAKLGYELRYRGLAIAQIRQLILPSVQEDGEEEESKTGLDDYLMHDGPEDFEKLVINVQKKRLAFPRHPSPRTFINKKLQQARIARKEMQDLSMAMLMELEARGRRLVSSEQGKIFFFDDETHRLMHVDLDQSRGSPLHETRFGQFLYQEFNISGVDNKLIGWLASLYTGEPGMESSTTKKVLAKVESMKDCIAVQLSDSDFVIVTGDPKQPFLFKYNGSEGVLFEQDQVVGGDTLELKKEINRQMKLPLDMFWLPVLASMNFRDQEDEEDSDEVPQSGSGIQRPTADQQRLLACLLYYISPWLLRWRGTQLPIELMLGEAGSGKSSVYGLRQTIMQGRPSLNNLTNDIKDWYASITARGGIHVLDNVKFVGGQRDYRQRLSDEICRLVTEPDPTIELRKLYTTSDVLRLPVNTTFAMTAIEQPFHATDLIQRSTIFELQAVGGNHDADWAVRHLDSRGGRTGWLAHHLIVLHLFLKRAVHEGKWDSNYKAHHRLANYEQCLSIMAEVFGLDKDWIPGVLSRGTKEKMTEADWVLQGLKDYVDEMREKYKADYWKRRYSAKEIVAWAAAHENHHANGQITNPHRLGRYLTTHAQSIERIMGLTELAQKVNNKRVYAIAQIEVKK